MNNSLDPGESQSHAIKVELLCHLSDAQQQGFIQLLNELIPITLGNVSTYLHTIIVAPKANIEQIVNQLIQIVAGRTETYSMGVDAGGAVAVPIELDSKLMCFIVLPEEELRLVTPDLYHPQELVSSLVEELLHVQVYAKVWQCRGALFPPANTLRQQDLSTLCMRFHDEYVVGRSKAGILSSTPLMDYQGGLTPFYVFYPFQLSRVLNEAVNALRILNNDIRRKKMSVDDAWYPVLDIIYRGILEPLARDAAFREGNRVESSVIWDANASSFYQELVEPYWRTIKMELERSFMSDVQEIDDVVSKMVSAVQQLLEAVGFVLKPGQETLMFVNRSALSKLG